MDNVTVINIMADGSVCADLTHYLDNHDLPEVAARVICNMMKNAKTE